LLWLAIVAGSTALVGGLAYLLGRPPRPDDDEQE
jgi:hypothetical protein